MAEANLKDIILNEEEIAKFINDTALNKAKKSLESFTPEDTKKLVNSYKIEKAKKTNRGIEGSVYVSLQDVEYAKIVNDGVDGKEYQYHKPKGVDFGPRQQGAHMFERAEEEIVDELLNDLAKITGL